MSEPPLIIIYDGECPVCRRACDWIRERSTPDAFRYVACQSEEREMLAPQVEREACLEAMHVVSADGTVFAGADAVYAILGRLPGWRRLRGLYRLPGARAAAPLLYGLVSRNRFALSAFLKKKGESCSIDRGCR